MSDPVRPVALLPGEVPSRWRLWRSWLLRTFPGRALTLGAAIKAITWPINLFSTPPPALEAIDMVGSLALLFALAYGADALRGVGEAPAVVARAPQADPLVRVRRRGAGAARDHVLPARGTDPRVQRQLVPRAVAHPQPDRPGPLSRADRAARSAALHQRGSGRRNARAPAVEHRDTLSVSVGGDRAGGEPVVQGRTGAGRAGARRPCPLPLPVSAGPWGHLDPPDDAAEVGRLRRFWRIDRLQRAGSRRRDRRRGSKRGS